MSEGKPSINVQLFHWKSGKNGTHPIKVIIRVQGRKIVKSTGLFCLPSLWDTKKGCVKVKHPDSVRMNGIIMQTVQELNDETFDLVRRKMKVTSDRLRKVLEPDAAHNMTVLKFWEQHIEELKESGQVGTAAVHRESRARFSQFLRGKDITFEALDIPLLQKYAIRMKADNLKDTSINLRFRDIRAIYRKAASRRIVNMTEYPFGGKKDHPMKFWIGQFKTVTRKRAIGEATIRKLIALELDPVNESDLFNARQYFMLSYYMGGMPWADLIRIRWKDIDFDSQSLTYIRVKTKLPVHVNLSQPAINIFSYYRLLKTDVTNNYALPVLDDRLHVTESQIRNKRRQELKNVNKSLHVIEQRIGLSGGTLTSYVARHTAATQALRKGATKARIQKMLGQQEERTTDIYLASLPSDDDIHKLLIFE